MFKKKETEVIEESACAAEDSCCGTTQVVAPSSAGFGIKPFLAPIFSFVLLVVGIALDFFDSGFFKEEIRLLWFIVAYLPVGIPVLKQAWENIVKGEVFTEFFLMGIATVGAFALGHYEEGVAVMLFYSVGELFQHSAVEKSRRNIKALLDIRPNSALVFRNGKFVEVHPEELKVGEKVQVRSGEKIPVDGVLLSQSASLNTAAITGESKPDTVQKGEKLFAGSINLEMVLEMETTKIFTDSSIAKILHLVQEATARKSKTELFIRKFAKVYTPIVVFLAIALTLLPYFFIDNYIFSQWLYRALVFLVISCPCALVISIPLGYFGGLGAASQNGILFKGASFLDSITKVDTVVLDKTGTLTQGVFKIKEIKNFGISQEEMMSSLRAVEAQSTHPIARAICEGISIDSTAQAVKEIGGKGLRGNVNGKEVLAGNKALMDMFDIAVPQETETIIETAVLVAIDGQFAGYVTIADKLKGDAREAIDSLRALGIKDIVMLSGDKHSISEKVAAELGITLVFGGLLPEEKLRKVEELKRDPHRKKVAFVGDGINDAPVIAASDVGIAMGALGSDVAIETADVIIQTDHPSKIARAIRIGRSTRHIVWQNIVLAFGVKLIVLVLGAGGIATMWEAVFADVGVAFLAILNAIRLQKMTWK